MASELKPLPPLDLDPLHLNKSAQASSTQTVTDAQQGFNDLLVKIYDKLHADGEKIIADMKKAQSVAAAKLPDGTTADEASTDCLNALIPIIQLIVENQLVPPGTTAPTTNPTATPDGLVTAFVKIRVVINAMQSASVQKGCSWLQQSIQQGATQGIASLLGGVLGIGKLGGLTLPVIPGL